MGVIFTVLAVLCLVVVVFARESWQRPRALWGLTLCTVLALVTFWFAGKENQALVELSALIEPVPEISDVTWIMSGPEMEQAQDLILPQGGDGSLADMDTRIYNVVTDLPADQAAAFYMNPAHCRDWVLDADNSRIQATRSLSVLLLKRGEERMVITVLEDWTETQVWYAYTPAP